MPPVTARPVITVEEKQATVTRVVTAFVAGTSLRTRSPSAIQTVPLSYAMPVSALKRAAAPVPSAVPGEPAVPATVVTAPLARVRRRMVWFPRSVIQRAPPPIAMPYGWLKRAAAPVPSALPTCPALPATVVTAPVAMTILRMVWFPESVT